MENKISNINQVSSVSYFTMTINDLEIMFNDVIDMEINWKDFEIKGYVKINDLYDLSNLLDINNSTVITLYIDDIYNEYFSRQFIITKYNNNNISNSKFLYLEFQDIISYKLNNMFVSKTFSSTLLSDVFSYCLSVEIDNLINGFPIEKYIDSTTTKMANRVLTSNKSALKFLQEEANKEGFKLYQTKKGIHLKDIKNLTPSKLETVEFLYKESAENPIYGFNIMDFKTINDDQSNETPASDVMVYDPSTKKMIKYNQNISDISGDIKSSTSTVNPQSSSGKVTKTQEYLNSNNIFMNTYLNYLRTNGMYIAVPGNIKYNSCFIVIDVAVKGSMSVNESMNEGDRKLSGKYICTEIVDKFLPGEKFIQRMKINRVDYTNVN